jgi:hypothetical protein
MKIVEMERIFKVVGIGEQGNQHHQPDAGN